MHKVLKVFRLVFVMVAVMLIFMSLTFVNAYAFDDPLTIEITVNNKVYDGNAITISVQFYDASNDIADIDSTAVTIAYYDINDLVNPLAGAPKDFGSYRVVITYNDIDDSHMYGDAEEYKDFSITKRPIEFVISSITTYGIQPIWQYSDPYPGTSFANGENHSDLDIDFTAVEAIRDKGLYLTNDIVYSIGNDNYDAIIQWSYDIKAKNINVTIQPISLTYGDNFLPNATINVGSTFEYDDNITDLDITFRVNGNDFNYVDLSIYGAGSHTLSAIENNNNYNVTFTNGTLNISKYIANITVSGTCVYGTNVAINRVVEANESIFNYNLKNNLAYNDKYIDLGIKYYVDNIKPIVGSNHIIRSITTNNNYIIELDLATLVVTPRSIEVKINDLTVTYGNIPPFSLTIINGSYANGDNINSLQINYLGNGRDVREEPYVVTGVSTSPNYNAVFIEGNLTIIPRNITIIVSDLILTYGDNKSFSYNLPPGQNLPYADSLAMLGITINAVQKNVGTYQANMSYNNANYNINFIGGQYTINKKPIEIKINDLNIVYGDTPIYTCALWNGTLVSPDNIDDLNIQFSAESLNYGDRYTISGSYNNPNYNIVFREGRITIAKKPINIIIDNVTIVYGESPVFTYRLAADSTLASEDTLASLNIVCSSSGVNVIDAPVEIAKTYQNSNYDITFTKGQHIITPRDITLQVKNVDKEYGVEREFSSSDVEIINGSMALGEPLSGLNLNYDLSKIGTVIGEYPLILTAENSNYNIVIYDGTFNINKRKVIITVEDAVKAYGDKDKEIIYTSSVPGIVFSGKLTREKGEKAGTYKILIGNLSAGDNYDLKLSPATLTIDSNTPPIAYVGGGFFGLSLLGLIFVVIRKIMGAKFI